MLKAQLRNLRSNWPMWFVAGVAVYFLLTALDVSERVSSIDPFSSKEKGEPATAAAAPTTSSSIPAAAVSLDFKVKAFNIHPDTKKPGSLKAELNLEVANNSKANVKFNTEQLQLKQEGVVVTNTDTTEVTVSPHLPVIVPVSFRVSPKPGATYELVYYGHTVYSGKPL